MNEWRLGSEEEEFTVMKVIIEGEAHLPDRQGKIISFYLLDKYNTATKTSPMARTTGYTCTAAINLIAKDLF